MRDISSLENHRFRRKLVQIRRMNLHASVASERVRALLGGKNKIKFGFRLAAMFSSGHALNQAGHYCNGSSVAVALWGDTRVPAGKRLHQFCGL